MNTYTYSESETEAIEVAYARQGIQERTGWIERLTIYAYHTALGPFKDAVYTALSGDGSREARNARSRLERVERLDDAIAKAKEELRIYERDAEFTDIERRIIKARRDR